MKKIGQFVLIEQIGAGAFSTVYKAKNMDTKQKVAIKVVPINKHSEKNLKRVKQEIDILCSISHPNIMKIYDYKKSQNNWYIILEYCKYGSLNKYIQTYFNGKFPECIAQQVIQQLTSALRLLRQHKIVHRDLKLANLLVGDKFVIKIGDFGFAKYFNEDTFMNSMLGTPVTM